MIELHLVRHGETDWNREGRVQGSSDVPLNAAGRRQAQTAGERFAAMDEPPTVVVTSDLRRASETADILAAALGADAPRAYAALRERGYGEAEGMHAPDVVARWGEWATQQVPGAEPWHQLRERAVGAVIRLVRDVRETDAGATTVLVVSHGALIREVVRHLTDGRLPDPGSRLGNLEGVRLTVEDDRVLLSESPSRSLVG